MSIIVRLLFFKVINNHYPPNCVNYGFQPAVFVQYIIYHRQTLGTIERKFNFAFFRDNLSIIYHILQTIYKTVITFCKYTLLLNCLSINHSNVYKIKYRN